MNPVNPTSLVRLHRKITGITAMQLPFLDAGAMGWGATVWGSIHQHLLRTVDAGLVSILQDASRKHFSFQREPAWERLPLNVIPSTLPHRDTA